MIRQWKHLPCQGTLQWWTLFPILKWSPLLPSLWISYPLPSITPSPPSQWRCYAKLLVIINTTYYNSTTLTLLHWHQIFGFIQFQLHCLFDFNLWCCRKFSLLCITRGINISLSPYFVTIDQNFSIFFMLKHHYHKITFCDHFRTITVGIEQIVFIFSIQDK